MPTYNKIYRFICTSSRLISSSTSVKQRRARVVSEWVFMKNSDHDRLVFWPQSLLDEVNMEGQLKVQWMEGKTTVRLCWCKPARCWLKVQSIKSCYIYNLHNNITISYNETENVQNENPVSDFNEEKKIGKIIKVNGEWCTAPELKVATWERE